MQLIRTIGCLIPLALLPGTALAQSAPNWPQDYIPATPEWQHWLSAKQDYNPNQLVAGAFGSVATNAALRSLVPTSLQPSVLRQGFYAAGDGGAMIYTYGSSPCSIGGGAGDNGWQISPAAGPGCWTAELRGLKATPLVWGAVGNGVADDTAAVQAAITATGTVGVPLELADASHVYFVSSGLNAPMSVDLEGYAPVGADGVANGQNCISGLATNSDINLLTLSGPTAIVRNLCLQMSPSTAVSRAGGSAILLGGSDQQADVITGNTVFRPYDGIGFGSATANNLVRNSIAENNTIRDPTRYGIAVGLGTSGGVTANISLNNNTVGCDAGYNTNGIGIAFFDGSLAYNGTNVGPSNCFIGVEIVPGSVGSSGQNVNGTFNGVLSDSAGVHYTGSSVAYGLYSNPSNNLGTVEWLSFVNTWSAGAGGPVSEEEMYIGNTNGGNCSNIKMTGATVHSTTSQTGALIDVQGCGNVVISGSEIDGWPGGTVSGAGINIGANTRQITISGNHIGKEGGATLSTGISIATGAAYLTVQGNELSQATTPIVFTPQASTDRVVFAANQGVDDVCPAIASAATITLFGVYPCYHITGTTNVSSITNAYVNRAVLLFADSGINFVTGGSNYGLCVAGVTIPASGFVRFAWNQTNQCWAH